MLGGRGTTGRRGRHGAIALVTLALVVAVLRPASLLRLLPDDPGRAAPTPAVGASPAAPADPTDRPPAPVAPDGAAPDPTPGPEDAPPLRLTEVRGGWRLTGGTEEAAALGLLLARTHLAREAGVVDVALEAVERPAGDLAVVTVLALVVPRTPAPASSGADDPALPGTRDDPEPIGGRERLVRLAVPVAVDAGGARPAGTPWPLPAPDGGSAAPSGRPIEDPATLDAARAALTSAGLDGAALVRLERTASWPVLAHLTPSDGRTDTVRTVWLRWHLDRFVVAGVPLDRATDRSSDPTREG